MKKDYLLYLKKALSIGCIATSLCLLTGCDDETKKDEKAIVEEEEEKSNYHEHLMVDIGGTTYIFRECDENIGIMNVVEHQGNIKFYIYDKNNNLVIDQCAYGDSNYTSVYSEVQEMAVREFEDAAIENGAVIYRGLSK